MMSKPPPSVGSVEKSITTSKDTRSPAVRPRVGDVGISEMLAPFALETTNMAASAATKPRIFPLIAVSSSAPHTNAIAPAAGAMICLIVVRSPPEFASSGGPTTDTVRAPQDRNKFRVRDRLCQ